MKSVVLQLSGIIYNHLLSPNKRGGGRTCNNLHDIQRKVDVLYIFIKYLSYILSVIHCLFPEYGKVHT